MDNEVIEVISGRLGRDPYLAYSGKGNPICEMSLAIKNEQNETIWRKIVVFGKLAEMCKVHLKKGCEIFVRGRTELKSFINNKGTEVEYFEVLASSVGQSLL